MKKIKPYFLRKIKVKKIMCRLLQCLFGALCLNTTYFKAVGDIIMHLQLLPDKTGMIT